MQNVTLACFGLSYLLALLLELARLKWPRPGLRIAGLILGGAGLFAHSWFLVVHKPSPATAYGALLAVAWVLAIFYLYGTLHHSKRAWAIFVLPFVLALVSLAFFLKSTELDVAGTWESGNRFWGALHGILLLLASVGVCVGAIASVMYLVQARRLRMKLNPLGGVKMLSLERLEGMNRRAINAAFPLLSVGLIIGLFLLKTDNVSASDWFSVKVLGTLGLWIVFLVLLYLRYAVHLPGRRLAMLTIFSLILVVAVLIADHSFARAGDSP
jgi:ABC-type transport system involved in cytochrome c biogenesis permease subunit